jgi:SNF2 family DNA or RNA helicase
MSQALPLFRHQTQSIEAMRGQPAIFDASDPGTGKTRVAIEVVRARIRADGRAVLVVAPKTLLRSAWRDDILKFAPELITSLAYAENREEAFKEPADVYITNHDAVNWLALQSKAWFKKRFSTLVVDESGAFKHHTSKRSRAIRTIAPLFDFRENMNGTVNPNTILDAWHQYFILDGGQRLGKSFFHFRNSVCKPTQVGPQPNMVKWEDREGAEAVVASLVRDITIRHVFEDCVDIPPNHEYTVKFVLKPKHERVYKQMQYAALATLDTGTVTAINAAAVTTKLLQIASGAVYESQWIYHIIDEDRNEMVMDLLEERKHTLVFFNWKHQKDQLVAAAKRRGFTYCVLDGESTTGEREEAVRLFEAGFFKVMFAHPQSAAHGLTLVRAATTIWASPTYNLEHFVQGNKRIYRAGQTQKTETIVILAEGTIDEKVYAALATKKVRMTNLLQELKEAA